MKRVNRSYKEEATTALFKCWESKTSRNIIMRWWNGQTDRKKNLQVIFHLVLDYKRVCSHNQMHLQLTYILQAYCASIKMRENNTQDGTKGWTRNGISQ